MFPRRSSPGFGCSNAAAHLAVCAVICNLDSYLTMRHNYYLHNDPVSGRWRFIAWDHNESYGVFAERAPHTLLAHPADSTRNVNEPVVSAAGGFRSPGLRSFLARRRAFLAENRR